MREESETGPRHSALYVADFLFTLGLASRTDEWSQRPSRPESGETDGGVPQLNTATRFSADGDSNFQVLWEDGDRVFCRAWRQDADGSRHDVLAVLPAAEHPTAATLERLAHEYGLKDALDGTWATRPLELVRDRGQTMLVLENSGSEPLDRLLGTPMEAGGFL